MVDDLTAEDIEDLIECAVDEVVKTAVAESTTINTIRIMLTRFNLNVDETIKAAMAKVKEEGIMIKSGEGFAGSGRLQVKG